MAEFQRVPFLIAIVLVLLSVSACPSKDGTAVAGKGRKGSTGLRPGINYMQPMRWRVRYDYRVQDITPQVRYVSTRPMPGFKGINAVGKGNYEVWFTGPREGEGVRDVKLIEAIPPPTAVSEGSETEPIYYYYNFSPGSQLPDQISATLTWEFTTFERYTHWDGTQVGEYDKQSELYKKYTQEEAPIDFEANMVLVAKKIQKEALGDPVKTARGCYDYIINNIRYDQRQEFSIVFKGQEAMVNASRSWQNKHGICDEFASIFCAMTRSVGIPSRPVAGYSHQSMLQTYDGMDKELKNLFAKVERKYGPYLKFGGHAWAEYYLPDIGWVPMDPTWGEAKGPIEPYFSWMGANRKIKIVDYYEGRMDPLRVALYKDWNYTLDPAPISPGAAPVQDWMLGCTERSNGVGEIIHGWEGVPGFQEYSNVIGSYRSAAYTGTNFTFRIEALGSPEPNQIAAVIDAIEKEGDHYIKTQGIRGSWPMVTVGDGFNNTVKEMVQNLEKEFPRGKGKSEMMANKVIDYFNLVEN